MTVRPVLLDAGEALELGELLGFLRCWLDRDGDCLAGPFGRFVGNGGYDFNELHRDLSRFALLLGCDNGELLRGDER